MKEDQDLSTRTSGRSPMHDLLECGCRDKCTGTHRHARVDANNASEKMEQSGTWARKVARAIEWFTEDEQELKVWAQKRKQRMQRRYEGLFMRMTRKKEQIMCKMKW